MSFRRALTITRGNLTTLYEAKRLTFEGVMGADMAEIEEKTGGP